MVIKRYSYCFAHDLVFKACPYARDEDSYALLDYESDISSRQIYACHDYEVQKVLFIMERGCEASTFQY